MGDRHRRPSAGDRRMSADRDSGIADRPPMPRRQRDEPGERTKPHGDPWGFVVGGPNRT